MLLQRQDALTSLADAAMLVACDRAEVSTLALFTFVFLVILILDPRMKVERLADGRGHADHGL